MLIFAEMTNRITMRQTKRVIALGQLGLPVRIRKTGDCRLRFGASVPAELGATVPGCILPFGTQCGGGRRVLESTVSEVVRS